MGVTPSTSPMLAGCIAGLDKCDQLYTMSRARDARIFFNLVVGDVAIRVSSTRSAIDESMRSCAHRQNRLRDVLAFRAKEQNGVEYRWFWATFAFLPAFIVRGAKRRPTYDDFKNCDR